MHEDDDIYDDLIPFGMSPMHFSNNNQLNSSIDDHLTFSPVSSSMLGLQCNYNMKPETLLQKKPPPNCFTTNNTHMVLAASADEALLTDCIKPKQQQTSSSQPRRTLLPSPTVRSKEDKEQSCLITPVASSTTAESSGSLLWDKHISKQVVDESTPVSAPLKGLNFSVTDL